MCENKVPIVFALNNSFAMPTMISIISLLFNSSPGKFYDIYLFISAQSFSERENLDKLKNMFSNFNITYVDMGEAFNNANVTISHLSKEAFYRLLIPNVLPQYDKCIYLDGDTIVEKDILNLYDIDIDNYYVAGVRAPGINYSKSLCKKIGLPSIDQYINSGVLVMNLRALRENKLKDKFGELANKNIEFPGNDQDVINIFCYNHIKLLPLKFNSVILRIKEPKWKLGSMFTDEEIFEANNIPVIIHYAGEITKPWKNTRCIFSDNWWKYALMSSYKDKLLELRKKLDVVYDIKELIDELKNRKNVIIFGFSEIGRKLYNLFIREGLTNICCFCDNDIKKQNNEFVIPVFSLDKAIAKYNNPFFLIVSQRYSDEIEEQILNVGISMNKILKYYNKDYRFFSVEDEKWQENEIKEKYWIRVGKNCNLQNPKTFNEKLQWLKLYYKKSEHTQMVDKYKVRQYVKEKIGEEYLIPLLGVYDNFEEIEFNKLPNDFVIKCNHDSGSVFICRDKERLDIEELKSRIDQCMNTNYYYGSFEWPYKNIKPSIIIEKYLNNKMSDDIIDYKFFCFDGIPKFLYVSEGLENHKTARISFYDMNYDEVNFSRSDYMQFTLKPKKPQNFEKMKLLATCLANKEPFVRVDFYEMEGEIYFGELTFFPCSGYIPFAPCEYDEKLGELLKLPVTIDDSNKKII